MSSTNYSNKNNNNDNRGGGMKKKFYCLKCRRSFLLEPEGKVTFRNGRIAAYAHCPLDCGGGITYSILSEGKDVNKLTNPRKK
jgi:hypothetical protein